MKTYSIQFILLTTYLIGGFGLLASEVYYENPFLYGAKLEGNETATWSKFSQDFEDNESQLKETFHTNYDHSISILVASRIKESQYPKDFQNLSFSITDGLINLISTDADSFISYSTSGGYTFHQSRFYTSEPKSNLIKKGQKWIDIVDGHIYSGEPPFGWSSQNTNRIYLGLRMEAESEILGIFKIPTPWGPKDSIKVKRQSFMEIYADDTNSSFVPFNKQFLLWISEEFYFLKGLGTYQNTLSSNFVKVGLEIDADPTNPTNQIDIDSLPSILKKRFNKSYEAKFDSTTKTLNVQNFTEISSTQYQEILNQTKLNSWTWNGAFPWVYNSLTDSWFYYAFSGNSYNAYDARSGSWFTFDSGTGAWNPSN
jgi:hypothetical protein